jgi:hypothetical protein
VEPERKTKLHNESQRTMACQSDVVLIDQRMRRAVAGQFVDGRLDGFGGQSRVEFGQSGSQSIHENHFAFGFPAEPCLPLSLWKMGRG